MRKQYILSFSEPVITIKGMRTICSVVATCKHRSSGEVLWTKQFSASVVCSDNDEFSVIKGRAIAISKTKVKAYTYTLNTQIDELKYDLAWKWFLSHIEVTNMRERQHFDELCGILMPRISYPSPDDLVNSWVADCLH